MNKTWKRVLSLVVAMSFMLMALAVPVVQAAKEVPANAGWEIKYFKTFNAETKALSDPVTALRPGAEVYAQVSLTHVKHVGVVQMRLNATNMTIEERVNTDYLTSTAFADSERPKLQLAETAGANEIAADKTYAKFYYTKNTQPYEDNANKVFNLIGENVATDGVTLPLITYKVKVADTVNGAIKLESVATDDIGIRLGAFDENDDPIDCYETLSAHKVEPTLTLPTVSTGADSVTLVKGTAKQENVKTTGGVAPTWSDYSFRVALTDGTTDNIYPLAAKPATITETGAYVDISGVSSWALENDADTLIENLPVTIYDKALGINKTDVTLNVLIQATQYRVKANAPAIELPRGIATLKDTTKAKIAALLEKSDDGNTWAAVAAADIAATEATFTTQAGEAFTNMAAKDTTTTDLKLVVAGMTFVGDNKVSVKTIAPVSKDPKVMALKAGQQFTVYKSAMPTTFAEEVIVEETLSDNTKAESKSKAYTVDAAQWKELVDAVEDEANKDKDVVKNLTIAFTDTTITGGTIEVTAKDAIALKQYRVKADQSFTINKFGKVDTSKIAFEQYIQKVAGDDSTNEWVDYTVAGAITLSKFDNTKDGTNTVTVSVAGIELDPATITVKVEVKPVYSAAWGTEAAPKLAVGAAPEDIIDMLLFTADYSGVQEAVELTDVTLTGYDPAATGEQTVKVMHDGKEIGSLTITLVADASNAKADLPVAGVELVGKLTTVIEVEAGKVDLTVAANSGNNIKLLATVTGVDAAKDYPTTVEFPGFAPVDVTIKVAADGKATVELDPGAKLIAGYVAKANGDTAAKADINDNDFYAIAASFGAAPNGAKAKYDLNRDGKIDELDIQAVLGNLGTELTK